MIDLHHDTVASWASKFIPRFTSKFSYQSNTCLPIFLATFTTTFGSLLDALVLKKAALKRSSKRRLAASISSHIRSTASPGGTFFQRWTCWIRSFSCVCNLVGGCVEPTQPEKNMHKSNWIMNPQRFGVKIFKKNGRKKHLVTAAVFLWSNLELLRPLVLPAVPLFETTAVSAVKRSIAWCTRISSAVLDAGPPAWRPKIAGGKRHSS